MCNGFEAKSKCPLKFLKNRFFIDKVHGQSSDHLFVLDYLFNVLFFFLIKDTIALNYAIIEHKIKLNSDQSFEHTDHESY